MVKKERKGVGAFARAGWPGWLAASICLSGLALWAVVLPQPSIGLPAGDGLIKPKDIAVISSVTKLKQLFTRINYTLDAVRDGERTVPPLFLAAVPSGMQQIEQIEERKRVFLRMMLPLVLKANERVAKQRERLLAIRRTSHGGGGQPSGDDRRFLQKLAAEYGLAKPNLDRLILHVDVVPVSLALAQSAIESGWGTSKFLEKGNAPFGQWTTAQFEGMIPDARPDGATYKVRSFRRLFDSVRSYVHNLNTHGAYAKFREARAEMRTAGARLDSLQLAATLSAYSQEGEAYIELLRRVIAGERLVPFDRARLGERVPALGPDA